MNIEIGILIAVIGCLVGLAGWLSAREKKIAKEGEWHGTVNTSLNNINSKLDGIRQDNSDIRKITQDHEKRLNDVEALAQHNKEQIQHYHYNHD